MGLIDLLGLKPPKSKAKGAPVATAVRGDAAASPAMLDDATKYAAAKQAALDLLTTLTEPSAAAERKKIETELVAAAAAKAQGGDFAGGIALLQQVAARVTAAKQAAAAALADYESKRGAAQKLLDALRAHPQHARIAAAISDAAAKLAAAKVFADKGDYPTAKVRVEEARVICVAAGTRADDFSAAMKRRAAAAAVINALRGVANDAFFATLPPRLAAADADLAANPPKFAEAAAKLDALLSELGATIKRWYSTESKADLRKLKAKPGAAFVDADIKQMEAMQAQADAAVAAKEWSRAVLAGRAQQDLTAPVERTIDRRLAFDTERARAVQATAPLRARPALASLIVALDQALAEADALATRAAMRFESGVQALQAIIARCAAAGKIGDAAEAYVKERAAADKALVTLRGDKAAARLAAPLQAIDALLASAAALAGQADAAEDALAKWSAARADLAAAVADIAAAKKLAADLGGTVDAGAAAAGAADGAALKKALADLAAAGAAAQKASGADAAADAFKTFAAAMKAAQAAADANDLKTGKAEAAKAADALSLATGIVAGHAEYLALRKSVEDRRKALGASPLAVPLKGLIDPIDSALVDAALRDKGHDGAAAMAALRKAAAAATAAEQAAPRRKAFDDRAKATDTAVKALADANLRKALQADLAAATKNADAFHFDTAAKALDGIDVKLDAKKAADLATSNPNSADLKAAVQRMMKKGGDEEVDKLMSSLPDNVDTRVLVTVAKERFGVDLVVDNSAPDEAKTIKQMCRMLAKVPQDMKKNPSLKRVEHEKPDTNGGAYGSDGGGVITMNGRPAQSAQEFGSKQLNPDGTPELPDDVDPACQPKNEEKVDYFDFATLHEVGHSVDDAQNFMQAREGSAEFGGWRTHGADVDDIAKAVAGFCKYDKTPEQKQYVLDLILRKSPEPPKPPPGEEVEWQTHLNAVNEWHGIAAAQNVWWRQGDCDKITIEGRIYHEAYHQSWVSYLASARKSGITGYQFRAPGEWFAELYATFHMDKLKPSHPAIKWLSKLSAP